jgi:hypothetical protein
MDHDHANGVMARALPGQAEIDTGGNERDLQKQLGSESAALMASPAWLLDPADRRVFVAKVGT